MPRAKAQCVATAGHGALTEARQGCTTPRRGRTEAGRCGKEGWDYLMTAQSPMRESKIL